MVEELLEFSKMEDGRFTLRMEPVDLQAEFEDAIFTYRELFRQEGIELNYDRPDEDLPPIPGDPERLKQVFCNVLDNAAKHGGSGKRIDTSISREGEFVVVRIRDYGPGIPEAELPFIKQKFYKGSSKARGSGIGLAVCDEIVGLHNGIFTHRQRRWRRCGGHHLAAGQGMISENRTNVCISVTEHGRIHPLELGKATHGKTTPILRLPHQHRRTGTH